MLEESTINVNGTQLTRSLLETDSADTISANKSNFFFS